MWKHLVKDTTLGKHKPMLASASSRSWTNTEDASPIFIGEETLDWQLNNLSKPHRWPAGELAWHPGMFESMSQAFLSHQPSSPMIYAAEQGHLGGSVGWVSDSWFQLKPWFCCLFLGSSSRLGSGLAAWSLLGILSLPLSLSFLPPLTLCLSLSK